MKVSQFDAQAAAGFVTSQTAHVETQVYQIRYADIQYQNLIPVDTTAHPFAKTVEYYSSDKFGSARWINGNADDVPLAGTEKTKHSTAVHMAGIGYSHGWEEIMQAQMLGHNLPADDAMAARRAYEEHVDGVAMNGDTEKGFEGLLNHSAVPTVASTNGTWTNKTPDQILQDINDGLAYVHVTATNTVAMADTLLLPWSRFHLISTKRLTDSNETVLSYLRRNNVYTATTGNPLTIRGIRGLDSLGGSGEPRMVCYRRAPEVLKLHIPMPHRFLTQLAGWDGLSWKVPGVFRLGGLDIRLPKEVAYIEGI